MKEVISSHRTYYKLRVCQEAIWEAFRIFFDRVPNSEEYRAWVYACQHQNLCMDDLAQNFSSSQEHQDVLLRDPDGSQYNDIKEELTAKVTFDFRGLEDTVVIFWEMTLMGFIVKLTPD
uniref:Interphotoreceptor matrix proteoglycan 1a n=1 Tax=Takifugu rubripes TaxID=31033 RepID=A0A674NHK1_TAKRU